jgi:hypothetical protein
MVEYYRCITCHKVHPLLEGVERKCSVCGSTNGEVSDEHFKAGFEAGTYFNIDPKTGGPAKKRKRR